VTEHVIVTVRRFGRDCVPVARRQRLTPALARRVAPHACMSAGDVRTALLAGRRVHVSGGEYYALTRRA
jgi:hypothetical protein